MRRLSYQAAKASLTLGTLISLAAVAGAGKKWA
jgi:hypothetical protein